MKKELKKGNTKLSLSKMTIAKLRLNERQAQCLVGGNDTTKKPVLSKLEDGEECTFTETRTK